METATTLQYCIVLLVCVLFVQFTTPCSAWYCSYVCHLTFKPLLASNGLMSVLSWIALLLTKDVAVHVCMCVCCVFLSLLASLQRAAMALAYVSTRASHPHIVTLGGDRWGHMWASVGVNTFPGFHANMSGSSYLAISDCDLFLLHLGLNFSTFNSCLLCVCLQSKANGCSYSKEERPVIKACQQTTWYVIGQSFETTATRHAPPLIHPLSVH